MNRTDVTFDSAGLTLAGHLYLPETGDGPRPAIVVGHPGSGVKEQAAGLYASRLAGHGFVTLAFDAAVSCLTTRPEVDGERIGALGICASGGYVLPAAAGDHRIRAVATVSAVDIARQFQVGADGTQDPAVFQGLLDNAAAARSAAARGEKPAGLTLFPDTVEQARALGGEHGAEGFEYYRTPRAQHPRSASVLDWASIDKMAGFDAFAAVPLIGPRPLLLIAGDRAVTSWMSVAAFQRAAGPRELHWIAGASHVDLYDQEAYTGPALEELARFFAASLATASRS